MSSRLKKVLLAALALALLFGVSQVQKSLNRDRDRLQLTRVQPLENAPPVLAFTTMALGGFRGLISNALWIRATDLQDDDKFFEMAQLADWITKLEPHFVQVWLVQSWNMAYNISVKFKDFPDRWRWVKRGIELLRDEGLRYNPNEMLIYRELAWFFQHKLGQNLDDANNYYKQQWANEMAVVFDKKKPNLDELIHPQTADQTNRMRLLEDKYKMEPAFMKQVDDRYGPLEWRLPEAHAIYWASKGLEAAKANPSKVNPEDLITLRRVVYQSMQLSFQRGRLVSNPFAKSFDLAPNLEIIPKVSTAYEQAAEEDEKNHDHILRAHRNFLRDAVYFLFEYNRVADSKAWYEYLGTKYPDKTIIDGDTNSFPANVSFDRYVLSRFQVDAGETDRSRVMAGIEGLLVNSYMSLVIDEDDHAGGYKLMARQLWDTYMSKIPKERIEAIGLKPFAEIDREVLGRLLDPQHGFQPEVRAVLRSKLGMGKESAVPPAESPDRAEATKP
jgi:hypothetical protein